MEFSDRLAKLIEDRGMSAKAFVEDFNSKCIDGVTLSRSMLSNVKRNGREPRISTIKAIARYFNVSVDYLVGNTDTLTGNTTIQDAAALLGVNPDLLQDFLSACEEIKEKNKPKSQYDTVMKHIGQGSGSGKVSDAIGMLMNDLITRTKYYHGHPDAEKTELRPRLLILGSAIEAYRQKGMCYYAKIDSQSNEALNRLPGDFETNQYLNLVRFSTTDVALYVEGMKTKNPLHYIRWE